ncbi:Oxidoreductase molybdopterin binding domain protein [Anatilimnocola aggregata]|uniref:Oxidoreductase molybdopterin binding domain protein n=1 Tax=Anatilimnocola aggregata TaxID=2528021 RepID=A0A517Y6S7_9BACT|nr:molybdopterin-dependent oxidoreductase [Anatilimnocola aggregata]QDU25925.1 Oxidoreductase molybdopterin binding domain protein [Anatilimnocola aggregata]
MTNAVLLRITGEVAKPCELTFADLAAVDAMHQIADVSPLAGGRAGTAITLEGLLQVAQAKSSAKYLGLHSQTDNFHASIPLDGVRSKAFLIYQLNGEPLSLKAGGPCRFFVPDHLACRSAEIDECANVKFVDTLELTAAKGHDNRPHDDAAHAQLHANEKSHQQ